MKGYTQNRAGNIEEKYQRDNLEVSMKQKLLNFRLKCSGGTDMECRLLVQQSEW